jgi:hypothetical protein
MRKKGSSSSSRSKRVRGGAVMTRRSSGRLSSGRRSASESMSKKMLSVSKYVTILNKLAESKAIKKNDPLAGYILVPFVDSYQSGRRAVTIRTIRGGAGPARAASIADEPESQTLQERDLVDLLTRHGQAVLGFHGPCWWHRVSDYERLQFTRRCSIWPGISAYASSGILTSAVRLILGIPATKASRGSNSKASKASEVRPASASVVPRPSRSSFPPECVGQVYITQGMRFEYSNIPVELARSMNYFTEQYRSYCPLVGEAVPARLSGAELTRIISTAFQAASTLPATTEQFRLPARLESPHTRLTFCEYAAIFFFTRDSRFPFSTYILLNNSMNYFAVRNITAAEYVQRIRHPFVMLFYFALYKCPRILDIRQAGLLPVGMRHLHRFMVVQEDVFRVYQSQPLQNLVTFYCFQSFSFTLAYQNIGPFTNPLPHENKYYIVLLRIEITNSTSARLMSHFSELIHENEAIATPCVPYRVVGVQEFQAADQNGFKQEIRAGSGFDYAHPFDPQIRGFLVVTIREETYRESMTGRARALRG